MRFRPSKLYNRLTLQVPTEISSRQDIPHNTFVRKTSRHNTLILRLARRIKMIRPLHIIRPKKRYTPAHLTRIYPPRHPFKSIPITANRSAELRCRGGIEVVRRTTTIEAIERLRSGDGGLGDEDVAGDAFDGVPEAGDSGVQL